VPGVVSKGGCSPERMSLENVVPRARVSPATVSRVLNNVGLVKSSTGTRVPKAIEELKSLAGGVSRTLGLIVSNP